MNCFVKTNLWSSMESIDARKERMAKFIRALYLAKYVKKDNMPCEIEPGLFLGSIGAAHNKTMLKSLNVTHVLLVANALEPAYPNDFKYKQVEVLDSVDTDLEQHFEDCFTFIDEAKQEGGGVLVHCFAGKSRSVTIIVAYLMRTHRTSLSQALELVKSKRPQAAPNQGFLLQLQRFESRLGGHKTSCYGSATHHCNSQKITYSFNAKLTPDITELESSGHNFSGIKHEF